MGRVIVPLYSSEGDFAPAVGGGGNVAFDNANGGTPDADGGAAATSTLVVGTLTNGILIAVLNTEDGAAGAAVGLSVSSDLDGAFTRLDAATFNYVFGGGEFNGELWYRLAPSAGTHTVTMSMSEGTAVIYPGLKSFANVNQAAPFGTPTTHTDNTENIDNFDVVIATTAGDMAISGFITGGVNPAEQDVTSPATKLWETTTPVGPIGSTSMAAYRAAVGASTTINYTRTRSFGVWGVALKKA